METEMRQTCNLRGIKKLTTDFKSGSSKRRDKYRDLVMDKGRIRKRSGEATTT